MSALITQICGKKNAGKGSIAQSVGFVIGRICSYNLFLPLNSDKFCMKWFGKNKIISHQMLLTWLCAQIIISTMLVSYLEDKEVKSTPVVYPFYKMVICL